MRKSILLIVFLLASVSMFSYNVGDIVGDISWTDSNGEAHSIHELVDSGKVVFFFWGENW